MLILGCVHLRVFASCKKINGEDLLTENEILTDAEIALYYYEFAIVRLGRIQDEINELRNNLRSIEYYVKADAKKIKNGTNGMGWRKTRMIFRLGELFCGAGGMALGAISARIDNPDFRIVHSWANDIDPDACSTYVRNICPDNPESVICMDVKDLDIDSLGDIDGFAFGFPCNDFSLLGEKNGISGTIPVIEEMAKFMDRCLNKMCRSD